MEKTYLSVIDTNILSNALKKTPYGEPASEKVMKQIEENGLEVIFNQLNTLRSIVHRRKELEEHISLLKTEETMELINIVSSVELSPQYQTINPLKDLLKEVL